MRKIHIVVAGFTCTFHSNLGSSMPSGAIDAIAEHFDVKQDAHLTLLNSLYMVGYVISPLIVGPLSEYVGRRPVLLGTFLGYIIFMFACSGAPNYTALLVFRFLCGMNAAAPTTVISGLYADIYDEPSTRGIALALYMSVTTLGPYFGPVISGFASTVSWRWPFWIAGIFASVSLPIVLTIPETYAPVLYNKAVRKYQKLHRNSNSAGTMIQPKPFNARKIFLRPMVLLFTEPILASTAAYLTLAYGLLYIFFQAYPIVFQG
jgi:multidrug resistance protein